MGYGCVVSSVVPVLQALTEGVFVCSEEVVALGLLVHAESSEEHFVAFEVELRKVFLARLQLLDLIYSARILFENIVGAIAK